MLKNKFNSGNTPLFKIDIISKIFNLPNLYIKDESKNPFGTWKDRKSEFILNNLDSNIQEIRTITSGNFGYSLSSFLKNKKLQITSLVDKKVDHFVKQKLREVGSEIIELDLSKKIYTSEDILSFNQKYDSIVIDVTNGYEKAYENIIKEIKDIKFDYILCPIGSGEAFVGILNGIKKYKYKTKLVGVKPKQIPSVADKLYRIYSPYDNFININLSKDILVFDLKENEIIEVFEKVKNFIDCEYSSSVVFAVLNKLNLTKDNKVLIINSGRVI